MREVVSGSGSNTEFLSAFVDHHPQAEVKKLPSYIEDTPDLLREIGKRNDLGPLPPHAIHVSMDAVALYPIFPAEYSYGTMYVNYLDMKIFIDDPGVIYVQIYTRRKTRRITIFFLPAVILTI